MINFIIITDTFFNVFYSYNESASLFNYKKWRIKWLLPIWLAKMCQK